MRRTPIHWLAVALTVVGALNWGLVAIARFDLVAELFGMEFGETNTATRVIYAVVGLAGVVLLMTELAASSRRVRNSEEQPLVSRNH